MINEQENNNDTIVSFPMNKERNDRLDDPVLKLKNELLDSNDADTKVQSKLATCENKGNSQQNLGQLEIFNILDEQIKVISEHQEHIAYLIDEIDMYLPRKR